MEKETKTASWEEIEPKYRQRIKRLHTLNNVAFWVTLALAVFNVGMLIFRGNSTWAEVAFRGGQYLAMLLVLKLPSVLRMRFKVEVPALLSIVIVLFCFCALVLGDGLDFYGKFPWWDSVLHGFSGVLLSMIALWLIHVIMAGNDKYIYFNKYFLVLFLVMFSLGMGACWEIVEYTYDSLSGTNTQQFMASTTGSIFAAEDVPLCGHAALRDTMTDLILDLVGAFAVAVYGFFRHNRLKEHYAFAVRLMEIYREEMREVKD
ncbi:MAG: hypothetical protein II859_05560 [Bacteroidales bacterium]|nr:hypothetical protein [Bacteroidales bacterium]